MSRQMNAFTARVGDVLTLNGHAVNEVIFRYHNHEITFLDFWRTPAADWREIVELPAKLRHDGQEPSRMLSGTPLVARNEYVNRHAEIAMVGEHVEFTLVHIYEGGGAHKSFMQVPVAIAHPLLLRVADEVEAIQARNF